jgi:hypothetical protein
MVFLVVFSQPVSLCVNYLSPQKVWFETKKIKESIESDLNCTPMISKEVCNKQKDLELIYEKWAIYYKNEQNWLYCTDDDYDSKILEFQSLQEKDGGILITHENMFQ